MEIGAREGRQIAVGIGVGPQRDRAESVCVCVFECVRPRTADHPCP